MPLQILHLNKVNKERKWNFEEDRGPLGQQNGQKDAHCPYTSLGKQLSPGVKTSKWTFEVSNGVKMGRGRACYEAQARHYGDRPR
ncbi:hypothetical protein AMTR_s00093p00112180 [Amborella trichopoda]|uniref:Uncharacterized protein n=1 Tax=Amborella trichopoda TaxID=13333 RepID=W1NSV9_AMBTC|nr:hypothetical protein AMTR_s00093p00112180 [Amborella trichopoda]